MSVHECSTHQTSAPQRCQEGNQHDSTDFSEDKCHDKTNRFPQDNSGIAGVSSRRKQMFMLSPLIWTWLWKQTPLLTECLQCIYAESIPYVSVQCTQTRFLTAFPSIVTIWLCSTEHPPKAQRHSGWEQEDFANAAPLNTSTCLDFHSFLNDFSWLFVTSMIAEKKIHPTSSLWVTAYSSFSSTSPATKPPNMPEISRCHILVSFRELGTSPNSVRKMVPGTINNRKTNKPKKASRVAWCWKRVVRDKNIWGAAP